MVDLQWLLSAALDNVGERVIRFFGKANLFVSANSDQHLLVFETREGGICPDWNVKLEKVKAKSVNLEFVSFVLVSDLGFY